MSALDKGTVKVLIATNTYDVSTAEVERKLGGDWRTARITTEGYTLPLTYGQTVDIYFERGGISYKRFTGFLSEYNQTDNGKGLSSDITLYGKEANIRYISYKPTNQSMLATSLFTGMFSAAGIEYSISPLLTGVYVHVSNTKKKSYNRLTT
jgi:hypothetical protein